MVAASTSLLAFDIAENLSGEAKTLGRIGFLDSHPEKVASLEACTKAGVEPGKSVLTLAGLGRNFVAGETIHLQGYGARIDGFYQVELHPQTAESRNRIALINLDLSWLPQRLGHGALHWLAEYAVTSVAHLPMALQLELKQLMMQRLQMMAPLAPEQYRQQMLNLMRGNASMVLESLESKILALLADPQLTDTDNNNNSPDANRLDLASIAIVVAEALRATPKGFGSSPRERVAALAEAKPFGNEFLEAIGKIYETHDWGFDSVLVAASQPAGTTVEDGSIVNPMTFVDLEGQDLEYRMREIEILCGMPRAFISSLAGLPNSIALIKKLHSAVAELISAGEKAKETANTDSSDASQGNAPLPTSPAPNISQPSSKEPAKPISKKRAAPTEN